MAKDTHINVTIQLYKMRDWRLVEAEDATGERRVCFLVPCLQNGIRFNQSHNLPYLSFVGRKGRGDKEGRHGYILTPYISKSMHEEMLLGGVSQEDDKHWAPVMGHVKISDFWGDE